MQLVIINAGNFIGRFAVGTVLRFVGVIDLTIITTIACAILIIGMIWLGSAASVVVLGVLYGLFGGMSTCWACVRRRKPCLSPDRYRYRIDGTHVGADV